MKCNVCKTALSDYFARGILWVAASVVKKAETSWMGTQLNPTEETELRTPIHGIGCAGMFLRTPGRRQRDKQGTGITLENRSDRLYAKRELQYNVERLDRAQSLLNTDLTQMSTEIGGLKTVVSEQEIKLVQLGTRLKDGFTDVNTTLEYGTRKIVEENKDITKTLKTEMLRDTRELVEAQIPREEAQLPRNKDRSPTGIERMEHGTLFQASFGTFPAFQGQRVP